MSYKKLKNGNYEYGGEEGIFRTIGGKRVFIKKGQSMSEAMKESGKFKVANKKNERANTEQGKKEIEDKVKQLYSDTWNAKKDYNELKEELDKMKKAGDVTSEDIKRIRAEAQKEYNKENEPVSKYAKLSKAEMEADLEKRKEKIDNGIASDEDKKYYEAGKKTYENYYGNKKSKEEEREQNLDKEIETISQEEYDKLPKDYKGTIKELVDTAEFRGEKKEDVIKKYKDLGYGVENDKTILKLIDKGTTLTPVKIENYIKEDETKGKYSIEYFKNKGVEIKDEVPDGYIKLENATTAPKGYEWYSNGKSRFGGEYKNALVKVEGEKGLTSRYAGTIDYLKSETNLTSSQIMELLKKIEKDAKK